MSLAGAKRSNLPTSIEQIKRRNKACGRHYFEPETMRFFRSRVAPGVFVGSNATYFITSEQFEFRGKRDARKYSVRKTKDGCTIDDVGGFQAYKTLAQAKAAAKRLAATGRADKMPRRKR